MSDPNSISLSSILQEVKESLKSSFPLSRWITAEIMEIHVNQRGHCYMELIEKGPGEGPVLARARATIWASKFGLLRAYFESSTGSPLKNGIKIMLRGSVEFHPQYGFSINITDIDPAYTLGDLSRKKQEAILKLRKEGVMDMNKEIPLPVVAQRIAVISSENAAGYGDFMDSIHHNNQGYRIETQLFQATMQGDESPPAIMAALDLIYEELHAYDAVVIIRGGGSKSDLECYNNYDLAYYITQFPLPVLTGIGHERDESVVDMVAWKGLKTPTAVAEYLLDLFLSFDFRLNAYQERMRNTVESRVRNERIHMEGLSSGINHLTRSLVEAQKVRLSHMGRSILREGQARLTGFRDKNNNLARRMKLSTRHLLTLKQEQLEVLESRNRLVHPGNVLKRGYSITSFNGKALVSVKGLPDDAKLETTLSDGVIISSLNETRNNKKKA